MHIQTHATSHQFPFILFLQRIFSLMKTDWEHLVRVGLSIKRYHCVDWINRNPLNGVKEDRFERGRQFLRSPFGDIHLFVWPFVLGASRRNSPLSSYLGFLGDLPKDYWWPQNKDHNPTVAPPPSFYTSSWHYCSPLASRMRGRLLKNTTDFWL